MTFPFCEQICRIHMPLDWDQEKNNIMAGAVREMAIFHEKNCPEISFLYTKAGFRPETIESERDYKRIPFVMVSAMKKFLLLSQSEQSAVLKLTSSGTSGEKTQIWFDQGSLDRAQAMMDGLWGQEGLVSQEKTNYVCFIYDPDDAEDLGISFSVKNEQRFAPVNKSYFAVRKKNGAWVFNLDDTISTLKDFASSDLPIRCFGVPSFMYELVVELKKRGIRFQFPKTSVLMTGGGWKAAEDRKVSREQFRSEVSEALGITNIRDSFGLAEHGAPYMECGHHRMHIPVYNRVLIRDPKTLAVLPPGKTGLLQLITPYNSMLANLSILTTDLGFLDQEKCICGKNSPSFSLVGRAGLSKFKGCAITADDLVKRN